MTQAFKSKAQRRKWDQLVGEGRVSQEQFNQREALTPQNIPERAKPRHRTVGASRSADPAKLNDRRY